MIEISMKERIAIVKRALSTSEGRIVLKEAYEKIIERELEYHHQPFIEEDTELYVVLKEGMDKYPELANMNIVDKNNKPKEEHDPIHSRTEILDIRHE